ncbi:flagellar hook-associated protein 3 FlgL [Lentibacillus persicus]|uniref:Flagellar hook-associated protein 3 FlgL n=1 Tax=Lentibacillus persicus TaxID=640948 RepID=A0A1I1WNW3_9BACI|nr:flagellar hook-associated protein FlgL [Lentibacillus persicus]SFD96894.1 flagellar hook-associated protein 3 FlgL [Lentibacillus persicus]
MRITQSMLSNNMLQNMSKSYSNMNTYMDQLSTGKKISRPSDDPFIAVKSMGYKKQTAEIEQYKRNTNEMHVWMDNSDAALNEATQTLQKVRELAVQASNDALDEEGRKSIQQEAVHLKESLIDIANTKVNGKYLFNGTNIDSKPVEGGNYKPESGPVNMEVSDGVMLKANVNGSEIFGEELFKAVEGFIDNLDSETNGETLEANIETIDEQLDKLVNERADLGARMNRLELVENRLSEQELTTTKAMSENEDIDYEEVITNLLSQESVHRAALSAGSRIIQPTLMDFLR